MFLDEGRFGPLGTPRRCWAPRGSRPIVGARLRPQFALQMNQRLRVVGAESGLRQQSAAGQFGEFLGLLALTQGEGT
jgi:hypothetical protein